MGKKIPSTLDPDVGADDDTEAELLAGELDDGLVPPVIQDDPEFDRIISPED